MRIVLKQGALDSIAGDTWENDMMRKQEEQGYLNVKLDEYGDHKCTDPELKAYGIAKSWIEKVLEDEHEN